MGGKYEFSDMHKALIDVLNNEIIPTLKAKDD